MNQDCYHREDIQCKECMFDADKHLPKWRQMQQQDADEFATWVTAGLNQRWQKGMETYESHLTGFKGDPIDHAIEEALDIVLYLWIAKRKQNGG